ncbi:MAG: hypothetical protein ABSH41_03945 [Syntrophobacteraceae bacterium]|jgi:hypothetical protein
MSDLSVFIGEIKAEIQKVEAWFKGVNWAEVVTYFQKFVTGLEQSVEPVLEAVFPGTASTISSIVNPLLTNANTVVGALGSAAQQYAMGSLSSAGLTAAAQTAQAAVEAASIVVGAAVTAAKAPVAAQTTAAAPAEAKPVSTQASPVSISLS